jgi:hypothetical protein
VVQPEQQEAQLALLEEQLYYYKEVAVPEVPNHLLELQQVVHQLEPKELGAELEAMAVLAEGALVVLAEVELLGIVAMEATEELELPTVVYLQAEKAAAVVLELQEQLLVPQVLGAA